MLANVHFFPTLEFGVNAGAYQSGAPYQLLLWCPSPSRVYKYYTRVEVKGIRKRSSLKRYGNNYRSKKFYSTGLLGYLGFYLLLDTLLREARARNTIYVGAGILGDKNLLM